MSGEKKAGDEAKPWEDKPLPARERLPKSLQKMVDDDEDFLDQIYEGVAGQTTDSSLRYAAYATRLRTILLSAHRYVAYTSDIGESFRPIAHPYMVKSAYAISWAYLIGDVGHEGYKAYTRNQKMLHPGMPGLVDKRSSDARQVLEASASSSGSSELALTPSRRDLVPPLEDWRTVVAERAVFQSLASMGLPAFTIHSIVRYSGRAMKGVKNTTIRTWGPIGLGLAAVPFLPYLFDKPVEEATQWAFHKAFETIGGPQAVRQSPLKQFLDAEKTKRKEKEL